MIVSENKNNLQYRKLSYGLILFCAALSLYLIRILHWTPFPDELGYALTAKDLLDRATFIHRGIMFFPPLFVYLSSILQWAGLDPLLSVRLLSALFGAGIVSVLYFILSNFYQEKLALICSFSLLFLYRLNIYSRMGQVETTHIFFCLLGFFFLLRWFPGGLKRFLLMGGFFLGVAVWAKEVAVIYIFSTILYLFFVQFLFRERVSLSDYLAFVGGLSLPLVALLVIGQASGFNLFFEISSQRGYDVNMLSVNVIESIGYTIRNLISMFGIPYNLRNLMGVPMVIICGLLLLRGIYLRKRFALLIVCYLIIALPFFVWFSRKFFYYLLPSSLFLFMVAFCEVGDYFKKVIGRNSSSTTKLFRSLFVLSNKPLLHLLYLVAGVLLVFTLLVNIPRNSKLYFTRGGHGSLRSVLFQFNPGDVIVASHTNIFQYVNEKENLGLTILPLFIGPNYQLNQKAISDNTTVAVITKSYYFNRLAVQNKEEWTELEKLFPVTISHKDLVVFCRNKTD